MVGGDGFAFTLLSGTYTDALQRTIKKASISAFMEVNRSWTLDTGGSRKDEMLMLGFLVRRIKVDPTSSIASVLDPFYDWSAGEWKGVLKNGRW